MRYYSIIIKDPTSGQIIRPSGLASQNLPATWTSFVNGQTIPGAQDIELSISAFNYSESSGASYVRIFGVSIDEVGQAFQLTGKDIEVYGGLAPGLPIATSAVNRGQQGLLISGTILQAFGNWLGVQQTIDLIIAPPMGSPDDPKNITFQWLRGTQMGFAIKAALQAAFPKYDVTVSVTSNLVQDRVETHFCSSLDEFADYVQQRSKAVIGGDYQGIQIKVVGKAIIAYDNTTQSSPKTLAFQDLIGQPVWHEFNVVQFKTLMRADLKVGDYIKFPPGSLVTSQGQAATQFQVRGGKLTFQGTFWITEIFHFGRYRQPDGESWISVFMALASQPVTQGFPSQ